jgi:hypothetical protein
MQWQKLSSASTGNMVLTIEGEENAKAARPATDQAIVEAVNNALDSARQDWSEW